MKLVNINNTDIEFELSKINYICPIDIILGNEIYDYITKYFSSFKYDNDYLVKYRNEYPKIIENNLDISRDKYLCVGINSYKDIDELLQSKKGTLFYDYNNDLLRNIDVQREIEIIERAYINIINNISSHYLNDHVINIKDFVINTDKLLSKEIEFSLNYNSTILDKFIFLIELFSTQEEKDIIFYLNNVDSYLSLDDLIDLLKIVNKRNVIIIVQSNHPAYFDYSDTSKIIYLINNRLEYLPNNNILLRKINNNITHNIEIKESNLIEWLKKYLIIYLENDYKLEEKDFLIYEALTSNKTDLKKDINYNELENSLII